MNGVLIVTTVFTACLIILRGIRDIGRTRRRHRRPWLIGHQDTLRHNQVDNIIEHDQVRWQ